MRLKQLMDIDEGRSKRAESIVVKLVSQQIVAEEPSNKLIKWIRRLVSKPYIITKVLVFRAINKTNGTDYITIVQLRPQKSFNNLLNSKVHVYCTCDDFMYRAAWVLNKDNSLFLNNKIESRLSIALTQQPKNMSTTTSMCKHLLATMLYIKQNYNNLNLIMY